MSRWPCATCTKPLIWPIGADSSGTATLRNPTASGTHSTAPISCCSSSPPGLFGEWKPQHHNVVDAARTSGVGHLVYARGLGADDVNEADWPTATPLSGPSETVVCRP